MRGWHVGLQPASPGSVHRRLEWRGRKKYPGNVVALACSAEMASKTQILIFEDGADAKRLALHSLLQAEMEDRVKIVTNAQEVWGYLKDAANAAEELVALFLDLEPAHANSLELLTKIRADRRLKHLHVVGMTTANSAKEDLAKCIALDVVTFVEKPITLKSFTKAIADSFHSSKIASRNRT
jgi:CheY-like chemotaxis protein